MSFFRLVAFRLVPLLLVMVIVWTGYQVSEALTRQLDERREYDDNRAVYLEKATEIAIEMSTRNAPSPTATASSTPTPTATATNTATPEPTLTPTLTPEPSLTPIPTETATLTPAPTSTAVPSDTVTATPQPTATPMREAQQATNTPRPAIFATNTPRSVTFATNTPQQSEQDQQPAITVAPTEPPTNTPVDLPTETEAVAEAQPTPANTLPPFYFPRTPEPGTVINGVPVPTEVPLVPREYDLFNVILLGGDGELTDDGSIRTDTMIVVSINKDTNAVSMLSLPRDLYVYVPTENGAMERLNTVYGFGQSIGWQPSAFDLLRQTIAYNFGINVHHYALVNFSGFEEIIDTLGGIDIAVDCAYQDYRLVGAELPEGATQSAEDEDLYTIGVGYYTMNGGQALWYARTRRTATDFDRGRRQQQILRAMYHQALDTGQIRNLPQLWGQVTDVMDTSVDVTDVFGLIPIALNLDAGSIRSYTFSLGYHTQPLTVTGNDGVTANVHVPVYETMRPVLEEFYLPPSNSQIALEGATIAVYNGTGNPQWDLVAAERLGWEGFRSQAMGEGTAEDADGTVLIDHTGQQKGSSLNQIAAILNVSPENIRSEPDANRQADFEVILGADYNSCTYDGILEVPQ